MVAAYPHYDIKAMRQPGKGQGRRGLCRLRDRARRCADHSRCRSHHAAGATAEVLGRDPLRQGRVRQRLAACLSDGAGGDAVSQSRRQQGLFAAVHLAAVAALHRHAVRHQGDAPLRLCAAQGRPQLFRRFRSVRGFRSDLRRLQARSQGRRDSDPLCQPQLRRDPDLPLSPRLHAAAHGRCSPSCASRRCDDVPRRRSRWRTIATAWAASRSCA